MARALCGRGRSAVRVAGQFHRVPPPATSLGARRIRLRDSIYPCHLEIRRVSRAKDSSESASYGLFDPFVVVRVRVFISAGGCDLRTISGLDQFVRLGGSVQLHRARADRIGDTFE